MFIGKWYYKFIVGVSTEGVNNFSEDEDRYSVCACFQNRYMWNEDKVNTHSVVNYYNCT